MSKNLTNEIKDCIIFIQNNNFSSFICVSFINLNLFVTLTQIKLQYKTWFDRLIRVLTD